jgi:branched-chain amino acid transport system substrate-binding protein
MNAPRKKVIAGLVAVGVVTAMSGCAAATSDASGSDSSGSQLKTGNGITADTVKILSLTDLSGPGASGGKPVQAGIDAYVKKLNADGGIDGRQVEVVTADTGYDPQRAVQLYQGAKNDVAAVMSYGTPTTDAIRPFTVDDKLALLGLKGPFAEANTFAQGTAFEVDAANLVTSVLDDTPNAKIGAIYQTDAVGDGVKRGVDAALKEKGAKLVAEVTADATSKDLTAQVTAMRQAGADHIVLGIGPGTTIAATGAVSALGYDAKLLSPGTAYNRSLLSLPVGPTMEKQMLITCSYPEWDQDSEGNKEFQAALPTGTEPNPTVVLGWLTGMIMKSFIEQAIKDGDATPAGIIKAAQHTTVDTKGLTPKITYGKDIDERTPFRQSRVCSVSNDGNDGITVVRDWFESDAAKSVKLQ